MPHPHEQKLHEVVNSLTSESFKSFVAARIAGTSRSPPSASPASPQRVSLNRSLRLIVNLGVPPPSTGLSERFWIGVSNDSSIGLLLAIADNCWTTGGAAPDNLRHNSRGFFLRVC